MYMSGMKKQMSTYTYPLCIVSGFVGFGFKFQLMGLEIGSAKQ